MREYGNVSEICIFTYERIEDFVYDTDRGATFEMWYKHFEIVFTKDADEYELSEED
jgi:hypothetical protein